MRFFSTYLLKYRGQFLTAVICVGLEALCDLMGPTLMANIIDEGIQGGSLVAVFRWGALMLTMTLIGAGFAVTRNIIASRVSQRIGADLRLSLFEKIMRFSEGSVSQIESGSLITRMTNDTTQMTQFANGVMRIFLKAPITCVGSIVLSTVLNPRLSIIIYAVVVLVGLIIYGSMKLSYPRFALLQKAMDKVNALMQEYLIGIRLVKAFGAQGLEEEKFAKGNEELYKKGVLSQIIVTLASPIMTLTVGLGTAAAIFFGSKLFALGDIQAGDISAFTIYMAQMLGSLLMITNIFNTFVRAKASALRLSQVMDAEEDFPTDGDRTRLSGKVTLEHVTFTYPGGAVPALNDVSFTIPTGTSLSVIGPTGSGKTTLCWLLTRFYDVDSGRILLGAQDIRDASVAAVRETVALVPQRASLFHGTVAENLRWGRPDASDTLIGDTLEIAQAGFVEAMQDGTDSLLSAGAMNLSGGQKQRLSIARGIIKDAPVLVLDDATSALDAITEAKVRKALLNPAPGHAVLIVTQRCTTAMAADRILVLSNGTVMGYGTHQELLATCPVYLDLYRSQVGSSREVSA